MDLTFIEQLILSYAPLVTLVLGFVASFFKIIKYIGEIVRDNKLSNEEKEEKITELTTEVTKLTNDNASLKLQLQELIDKIDKIKRK